MASKGGFLYNLMDNKVFYPVAGLIVVLLILLVIILSGGVKSNDYSSINSKINVKQLARNTFLVLFMSLLIFLICVTLIPNFKDLKELFIQINSVTYVILYTMCLVLFFSMTEKSTLNDYAYLILPVTISLGVLAFYRAFSTNYMENLDLNYERIKSMILLFCLITIITIFYNVDPGGLINEYFGYSLLLTIILVVFAFLYLIIVITLGNKDHQTQTSKTENNLLSQFSKFGSYGSILFIAFIVIITAVILSYPGGFFSEDNKAIAGGSIVLILLICILGGSLLVSNLFPEASSTNVGTSNLDLFKRALLMLFGTIVSIMLIVWLVYNVQNMSETSEFVSFVLNALLLLAILSIIYKIIFTNNPAGSSAKSSAFGDLVSNTIFYIPCLFGTLVDELFSNEIYQNNHWSMLALAIGLFGVYFSIPIAYNWIGQQGGTLLVNDPVYTSQMTSLGSYADFSNGTFDYNYAISFWIFCDAFPPSTTRSHNKYSSILNYADKPNVLYNSTENTLLITMKEPESHTHSLLQYDDNGNRILYKKSNMLLQKWTNVIINYNGGIMDIFLNGELVKSNNGVVPYYTLDNLTVGENDGYTGGLCNLVYHKKTLTANNIYYIYNTLKNRNPPVQYK